MPTHQAEVLISCVSHLALRMTADCAVESLSSYKFSLTPVKAHELFFLKYISRKFMFVYLNSSFLLSGVIELSTVDKHCVVKCRFSLCSYHMKEVQPCCFPSCYASMRNLHVCPLSLIVTVTGQWP